MMSDQTKIYRLLSLIGITMLFIVLTLLWGNPTFSLNDLWQITPENKSDYFILYEVRIPRVLMSLYGGALFALSGSIFQVMHHNSMASPDMLGVNATALFTMVLFSNLFGTDHSLVAYALVGAMLGFGLTIGLARSHKRIEAARLIIIGISISILFKALGQLLIIQSKESIHNLLHFFNGTLYQATLEGVKSITYPTFVSIALCLLSARHLDLLSLSPDTVKSIGLRLSAWQIFLIGLALFMSAIALSHCGSLGFIGLIAPNIARLIFGYQHRYHLLGSLLIGCLLVLSSDFIGHHVFYPVEIPTGMILIFMGTPVFLYLLKKISRSHYA